MARRDPQELSEEASARIARVVHSLIDDRVDRGVELGRPMRCDSCVQEKPAAGATVYGTYKLCNDCLLDYTLALASGRADSVSDFMTRRIGEPEHIVVSEPAEAPERHSVSLHPMHGRDKFMPSTEPS